MHYSILLSKGNHLKYKSINLVSDRLCKILLNEVVDGCPFSQGPKSCKKTNIFLGPIQHKGNIQLGAWHLDDCIYQFIFDLTLKDIRYALFYPVIKRKSSEIQIDKFSFRQTMQDFTE